MYRHKKVGDACIVDLGTGLHTLTSIASGSNMTNLNPSTNGKAEVVESFRMSTDQIITGSLGAADQERLNVGVILPKLGRQENISVSVSGTMWICTGINFVITPFISIEGSTAWSGQETEELGNIVYLPHHAVRGETCHSVSINTDVILKDMGYGMDLEEKSIAVGYECVCSYPIPVAQTVTYTQGTISARYNYSPIKTLDMEV